jgi:hypothetical protein
MIGFFSPVLSVMWKRCRLADWKLRKEKKEKVTNK